MRRALLRSSAVGSSLWSPRASGVWDIRVGCNGNLDLELDNGVVNLRQCTVVRFLSPNTLCARLSWHIMKVSLRLSSGQCSC